MTGLATFLTTHFQLHAGRRRWLGLALLGFAALAGLYALYCFADNVSAPDGWLPYVLSMAACLGAAYVLFPYRASERQLARVSTFTLIILAFIFGVAAFMRFNQFETLPFGTWWDEADIARVAQQILNDPLYRPFFVEGNDHPLHFFSLVALSFQLFGVSTESIRLVTVTFGLLTVGLAFFAGREMYGERFGLTLAFLFAISRWHVTFSRFGVYTISLPFFEMLTIWLLLRARRTGQLHDFAWAGLSLGLGVNFYIAVRLFVVAAGVYLAYWSLSLFWRKLAAPGDPSKTVALGGLAAFALAAWFAVAPVVQYALARPDVYWGRSSRVSIFAQRDEADLPRALALNTVRHLLMFNYQGDNNGRHNLPGEPMLDPVMAVLFVLGAALAISRLRHPTHLLFVVLFFINLLGGILTLDFEAPQSNRAFGSIAAALYFVALAVETVWRAFDKVSLPASRRRSIVTLATLGLVGYVVYYNAQAFFVRQANNDRVWEEFKGVESLTAYKMLEAGPESTSIYASMYLANHLVIQFLAPQVEETHVILPPVGLPIREDGDLPVAIFVDRDNTWIVDEAHKYYPNAEYEVYNSPQGNEALYTVQIAPEQIRSLQGATVRYWPGGSTEGLPAFTVDVKSLSALWPDEAPLPTPFIAQWESTLYSPRYGQYELILKSPSAASVWLDEQIILRGSGEQRALLMLAQGDHVVILQAESGEGGVSLEWRQPDEAGNAAGEPAPIPESSLYLPSQVQVHGLLGTYYNGDGTTPPPEFAQLDPFIDMYFHIIPLGRPYTIDWTGGIELPAAGDWSFALRLTGRAEVFIDDQSILNATEPGDYLESSTIQLAAGRHKLKVHFVDDRGSSRIHLYWVPPGGSPQIVPGEAFLPFP